MPAGPLGLVETQALSGAGMERDNPGFPELRLQDIELRRIGIKMDMIDVEAERLANPQTSTGQEPKERR